MIPLAALAMAGCFAVDAPKDQIVAGDLARGLPEWAAIPPQTAVALAPAPGVQRVLRYPELRRLAAHWNVAIDPAHEICFVRPVAAIPPDRMLDVMRVQLPAARIEIVEPSRAAAPQGTLEFPLSGLRPGYWFGHVSYGAGHRFMVWARVNVTICVMRIVAAADLRAGQPIEAAQLNFESSWVRPPAGPGLSIEEIAGCIARRAIAAGTAIEKQWLAAPTLVHRGDTVTVEVTRGATKLETVAVAEAAGSLGDLIPVLNLDSKRRFRARVDAKGKVSVKSVL
jgi:flagella basal body P-ring formation protein FlgA